MLESFGKTVTTCSFLLIFTHVIAAETPEPGAEDDAVAAANYQKYCSLCHGAERQGHVNDDAPSLRSKSLMSAGFDERLMAVSYGRRGTAMGGFLDEVGGPMSEDEIERLMQWLQKQSGVEAVELPLDPIVGDIELGKEIYAEECAVCHGDNGEGDIGPALGNPAMLSLTSDAFLSLKSRMTWTHVNKGREQAARCRDRPDGGAGGCRVVEDCRDYAQLRDTQRFRTLLRVQSRAPRWRESVRCFFGPAV